MPISQGKKHDVTIARTVPLPPQSIVTMDRGYNDYKLFDFWTENGIYFVTRLKENADYAVVEEPIRPTEISLPTSLFVLPGFTPEKTALTSFAESSSGKSENGREIVLLTNHHEFGASTISAIYKDRWQIELFFKALKQNLKVKTFVGTTDNALYIQIWTALIAMLLIKYLQFKSQFNWSLSNLVAFLRWNLFTYRDLWKWIDDPYDVLPWEPQSVQLQLPLAVCGQH